MMTLARLIMLTVSRAALVVVVCGVLTGSAAAQAPDATVPEGGAPTLPRPAPQASRCGDRLEGFIGSVLDQLGSVSAGTDVQRRALEGFKKAAEQARELVRSACANERAAASLRELEAIEKQAETALQSLGPALERLYASLSNEDKAKLERFTRQMGTWLQDLWRDFALNFDVRPPAQGEQNQFRLCLESFCLSVPQQPWRRPSRDRPRHPDEIEL